MYRFEALEGYPDAASIEQICTLVSNPESLEAMLEERLKHQKRILCCYAYEGNNIVAYKIGYQPRPKYFESWIGAVAENHRRQGLATKLMNIQHEWCENQGFKIITTVTSANNRAMLIVNLQAGFNISGTLLDRMENYQVHLQKHLDPNAKHK